MHRGEGLAFYTCMSEFGGVFMDVRPIESHSEYHPGKGSGSLMGSCWADMSFVKGMFPRSPIYSSEPWGRVSFPVYYPYQDSVLWGSYSRLAVFRVVVWEDVVL